MTVSDVAIMATASFLGSFIGIWVHARDEAVSDDNCAVTYELDQYLIRKLKEDLAALDERMSSDNERKKK